MPYGVFNGVLLLDGPLPDFPHVGPTYVSLYFGRYRTCLPIFHVVLIRASALLIRSSFVPFPLIRFIAYRISTPRYLRIGF